LSYFRADEPWQLGEVGLDDETKRDLERGVCSLPSILVDFPQATLPLVSILLQIIPEHGYGGFGGVRGTVHRLPRMLCVKFIE
jgi:hypothetical protein